MTKILFESLFQASLKIPVEDSSLGFSPLEKLDLGPKILPPFLGELGLEIRAFLGQVEPWLRSGWKIPSRRPSLYPQGTSFYDPVFFQRIDEIKNKYQLAEQGGRLTPQKSSLQYFARWGLGEFDFKVDPKEAWTDWKLASRDLKRTFCDRYLTPMRLPTKWDHILLDLGSQMDLLSFSSGMSVPPSYKPVSFLNQTDYPDHIGVQLRNRAVCSFRNSDPVKMSNVAKLVSEYLGLPVILYGAHLGNFTLPGVMTSLDVIKQPHEDTFAEELSLLSKCKIMIGPDSGWTDLMGWLQVPTILERQAYRWGFQGLEPFSPKIALLMPGMSQEDLIAMVNLLLQPVNSILPPSDYFDTNVDQMHPQCVGNLNFWQEFIS
jgi:hypothetical protein